MKHDSGTVHKQRAIKQMPATVAKSEISLEHIPEVALPDSRFTKLNQKAEEMKKVNLFYLKDILIKASSTQEERLECLWKIKRNVIKPVFGMAMKALLADFLKIPDFLIQMELLSAMQCSNHYSLLHPLKELLRYNRAQMDDALVDEIEDTISQLAIVSKRQQSFQLKAPVIEVAPQNAQASKSRNVNSLKMKGMTSLGNSNNNVSEANSYAAIKGDKILNQLLETEVHENNFVIPKYI